MTATASVPPRVGGSLAALATLPAMATAVLDPIGERIAGAGCASVWLALVLALLSRLEVSADRPRAPELVVCIAGGALATATLLLSGGAGYALLAASITMIGIHLPWKWALAGVGLMTVVAWAGLTAGLPADARARGATGIVAATASFLGLARILRRALLDRRAAELLTEELRQANLLLRDQAAERAEWAREKERARIARDLHDSLGHCLTALNLQLQLVARTRSPGDALARAVALTHQALAELRCRVSELREQGPSPSLERAVRELVDEIPPSATAVELKVLGEPRSIPAASSYALYRAAQEGLTNALRHAGASRVQIVLEYSARDVVSLAVSDDGRGADGPADGGGLSGARERAEAVGGRVSVRTRTGRGFTLKVEVPS